MYIKVYHVYKTVDMCVEMCVYVYNIHMYTGEFHIGMSMYKVYISIQTDMYMCVYVLYRYMCIHTGI